MGNTKIEWCDLTINPVVGCSKCSPGCDNCYAERFAARMAKHPNPKISGKYAGVVDDRGKWTGFTNFDVTPLVNLPRSPKRIFIGSMCDLFHDSVMDCHLEHIMGHIGLTRSNARHTFMLLTKRPERMRKFFTHWKPYREMDNLLLGVTVCNQEEADAKIPVLLSIPAAKRFVSVEPMLGPVDLTRYLEQEKRICRGDNASGFLDYESLLHWVVCGGETGPHARPMHPDWVRGVRDQCQDTGVPFFFKSWGEYQSGPLEKAISESKGYNTAWPDGSIGDGSAEFKGGNGTNLYNVGKLKAGRLLDGREWNEVPA